jgi:hypothetical protein
MASAGWDRVPLSTNDVQKKTFSGIQARSAILKSSNLRAKNKRQQY